MMNRSRTQISLRFMPPGGNQTRLLSILHRHRHRHRHHLRPRTPNSTIGITTHTRTNKPLRRKMVQRVLQRQSDWFILRCLRVIGVPIRYMARSILALFSSRSIKGRGTLGKWFKGSPRSPLKKVNATGSKPSYSDT